ncbi:MAG: hypothetical protein ACI8UD_003164 [Planctomycetota bacterium]|jgi:hypothetical protein
MMWIDTIFLGAILVIVLAILYAIKDGFNQVIAGLQTLHDQRSSERRD